MAQPASRATARVKLIFIFASLCWAGPVLNYIDASEAPRPGPHHVGVPDYIISEWPNDLVGIRTFLAGQRPRQPALAALELGRR
jgi:hypothetical protein